VTLRTFPSAAGVRASWGAALLVLALGLPLSQALGQIALVKNLGTNGARNLNGTLAINASGAVAVGNTVIVSFAMDALGAETGVSCADARGNSYGVDAAETVGSGATGARVVVCSSILTTALVANDTVTVTHPTQLLTNVAKATSVTEFSGLAGADRVKTATGNDTAPTSADLSSPTSQPAELLLGATAVNALESAISIPVPYTALPERQSGASNEVTIAPEYQIVSVAGISLLRPP